MAAKFVVFSLLVASVCGSGGYSSFSYGVSDPNTGDVKDQHEKRVGDSVIGKYSILESDGTKRIVEYEANAATGFNAVVRKEPVVGTHPSGPIKHESLTKTVNGSIAPTSAIAPAHSAPISPVKPQAPLGQIGITGAQPHPGTLPHPNTVPQHNSLAPSGSIPLPGPTVHLSSHTHPGTLPAVGFTGALGQQTPLVQTGALSYQTVFAHHVALGHPSIQSHPGANRAHPPAINYASPGNPHTNHLTINYIHSGYASLAGANGYASHGSGPQGVPAVSHFSHSVVHEVPHLYSGQGFGYNGAYDSGSYNGIHRGYNGVNGGYGTPYRGYDTQSYRHNFGGFPNYGLDTSLGHGIAGPHGVAHSYSSLTRGEAYPHGYRGYGARFNEGHGAGVGAGLAW